MGDAKGVGGESSPVQPGEASGAEALGGEPSGGSIENALHTPVKTLEQLKQVLIANLGEKEGVKMYNTFVQSFAMMMLSQVQQSAQQAQQAAEQMRNLPPG